MNRNISLYRSQNKRWWIVCWTCILGGIALYLGELCCIDTFPVNAQPGNEPGGNIENATVRLVDIDEPAVVRIITTLQGRLTVQFPDGKSVTFPGHNNNYTLEYLGSGAFISSHGDILTADHVIKVNYGPNLDQYLWQMAAQDIANHINQTYNPTPPYMAVDVINALMAGIFRASPAYSPPMIEAYFNTDYTGPLKEASLSHMPAGTHIPVDRIEEESTLMQRDTAIIHVNLNDTPSISLGDSTSVEPQDELTIIGFPGSGDISQKTDPAPMSFLTPSINKLFVSSIKQTDAGAPLIQVGGNIEDGDSGGPALDSNGNLVGIVSFGLTPNGGTTNFLQASQSAQEEIQRLRLDTTPGTFSKTWRQAFTDYSSTTAGHWQKALTEFQQLIKQYPSFQAIRRYMQYAQSRATHELPAVNNRPLIVFVLTLLLIGFGFIGALLLRHHYQQPQTVFHMPSQQTNAITFCSQPYQLPLPLSFAGESIEHPQQE